MRPRHIHLAPESYPFVFLFAFTAIFFAVIDWVFFALLFFAAMVFTLYFFRDPDRVVPSAAGLAVSPADGKIIRIARRPDPFTGEDVNCVSIFMDVFSVHINRSPVSGKIIGMKYDAGSFVNASWDKASKENERCSYQLVDEHKHVWTFVQVAGLVARRIVPFAEEGDTLARGERFGLIRFGSRVDVYVPDGFSVAVNIGDKVFAGQSVLARKG